MPIVPAAPRLPFWAPNEGGEAWDVIQFDRAIFGGAREPAVAKVTGSLEADLKKKRTRGRHGSRLIDSGIKPGEIKITLRCWTPEHFTALQDLIERKLQPWVRPDERRPIEVDYPALRAVGITILKCKTVHLPIYSGPGQELTCDVDFVQYTSESKRRRDVTRTQTATIPNAIIEPTPEQTQSAPDAPVSSAPSTPNAPP